ncbi:MAG: sugar phosphate isomerase/epimerase [Ruminococcaceae bacterium]|nr:sugar phosphate isomerase/epimerase [Oscillospiraceae bacterium]
MVAKLSIWSQYFYEMGPEDAVKEFIKCGISCAELSDEHGHELFERSDDPIATGKAFAEFLKENNFEMLQGHLWLSIKICSDETAVSKLFKWIDMYEAIGIKNMVLHCDSMINSGLSVEEVADKNIERLKIVAEHIKDKDITICLENLGPKGPVRNADNILYLIDKIGSDKFGVCLDTGHLNITDKNQTEFILKAGKKLRGLHIADNQGETDQHWMPFAHGTVDFKAVVKALREIDYNGYFNYEIPGESAHQSLEIRRAKIEYLKRCYDYLMAE